MGSSGTGRAHFGLDNSTHAAALIRAAPASRGALLAMLMLMLAALGCASVANLGAGLAQPGRIGAAARHEADRQTANLGAIDVQGNAARHHFYVVFLQARCSTTVAGSGTFVAGVNTRLKVLFHGVSFRETTPYSSAERSATRYAGVSLHHHPQPELPPNETVL